MRRHYRTGANRHSKLMAMSLAQASSMRASNYVARVVMILRFCEESRARWKNIESGVGVPDVRISRIGGHHHRLSYASFIRV